MTVRTSAAKTRSLTASAGPLASSKPCGTLPHNSQHVQGRDPNQWLKASRCHTKLELYQAIPLRVQLANSPSVLQALDIQKVSHCTRWTFTLSPAVLQLLSFGVLRLLGMRSLSSSDA